VSGGIVLIGLSGSGKSSAGRHLAADLRLPFYDTDRMIELGAGCTVADLFSRHGEEHFRALEMAAIARACAERSVVATGGGAVLSAVNRAAMRAGNMVVWLDPPLPLLVRRLAAEGSDEVRPLLAGDLLTRLRHLRDQRAHLYAEAAQIHLNDEPAMADLGQLAALLASLYREWCAKEATHER
jgi:shikimate kinase